VVIKLLIIILLHLLYVVSSLRIFSLWISQKKEEVYLAIYNIQDISL